MSWNVETDKNSLKSFWNSIFSNMFFKVFSFGFALVLIMFVRNQKVVEQEKLASIQILTSPTIVAKISKKTVKVVARQEKSFTSRQAFPDSIFVAIIDAKDRKLGRHEIKLEKFHFSNLPDHVDLLIEEPMVEFILEQKQSEYIKVNPDIRAELDPGFVLDRSKIKIEPEKVLVTGAYSEVANLFGGLLTTPINIKNANQSLSIRTQLLIDSFQSLKVEPEFVNIFIPIVPENNRQILVRPVLVENLSENLEVDIKPQYVDIELELFGVDIDMISLSSIRVVVDLSSLTPGVYQKKLIFAIPDKTSFIKSSPQEVEVTIRERM